MPHADINGQRIYFEDSGGDGPAVILAHGFGQTEFDGEPFTYWDSASDCLGLLDHLGIDRAVVGGMSQGGFISLRVALTAPDRVRALILLDTEAGVEDPEVVAGYDQMRD